MKNIPTFKSAALAAFLMASSAMTAQAAIAIETVTVGNAGNAADTSTYGAVAYSYDIGKNEVTNTQYAAFLNAKAATDTFNLYSSNMADQFGGITRAGSSGSYTYTVKSGFTNKAVNYVSFWDATRFTNWLSNGQGSGSTETGSYTLGSVTNPTNSSVTRNVGAKWVVASENEWYKAAYYDPTKSGGAGYWLHATKSDTLGQNNPFTATNGANYNDGDFAVYTGGTTDGALPVGSYSAAGSFYGTYDQGGNVAEWNEAISGSNRGTRGGSWFDSQSNLRSSLRSDSNAALDNVGSLGFRVASLAAIPEPSVYGAAMGVITLGVVMMRRRKARGTL